MSEKPDFPKLFMDCFYYMNREDGLVRVTDYPRPKSPERIEMINSHVFRDTKHYLTGCLFFPYYRFYPKTSHDLVEGRLCEFCKIVPNNSITGRFCLTQKCYLSDNPPVGSGFWFDKILSGELQRNV